MKKFKVKLVGLTLSALTSVTTNSCAQTLITPEAEFIPPGYDCEAQHGMASAMFSLNLEGELLGANFALSTDFPEFGLDGFAIGGSFNESFIRDKKSGFGSISIRPSVNTWSDWDRNLSLEVWKEGESGRIRVEKTPIQNFVGYMAFFRSWEELRQITSNIESLTFELKSADGSLVFKDNFNTSDFVAINKDLLAVANMANSKIDAFKTECTYHERQQLDVITVN
ncbi:hypothetical protein [Litorimonas sp. WD9-15]|uniref:hypothetical protein n=1 Tax=Litorimonas sp. WD9-15 TaxID=3418716 RepID=UPI003D029C0C